MGDELINLELTLHVVVDQVRELGAALDTTESASLPHTTGNELECWLRGLAPGTIISRDRTYVVWRSLVRRLRHQ